MSTRAVTPFAGSAHDEVCPVEWPDDRRRQVSNHLGEILRSPLFGSSKRYCALLRYIVEQTLEGRAEYLKERTIGVEAFGRPADYDTNVDHSVRSAAGEVRRRLALFYAEFGSDAGIRIDLQSGSYVPQIRFLNVAAPSGTQDQVSAPLALAVEETVLETSRFGRWRLRLVAVPVAFAALIICAISLHSAWQPRNPFDEFWNPVLSSPHQALLCVGGGQPARQPSEPVLTLSDFEHSRARRMNLSDAMALVAITGALESKQKPFRILNRASSTSFKDLQQGPFILIGGLNNEWTLRLTSGLRFTYDHMATAVRIADKQNPSNTSWTLSFATPIDQPVRDYAIVTRLHNAMTGHSGIIVAGIGGWGTQAAAEFVSDPASLAKLAALGPSDWSGRNLQVVIGTDVIRGSSGPPIILGSYFW